MLFRLSTFTQFAVLGLAAVAAAHSHDDDDACAPKADKVTSTSSKPHPTKAPKATPTSSKGFVTKAAVPTYPAKAPSNPGAGKVPSIPAPATPTSGPPPAPTSPATGTTINSPLMNGDGTWYGEDCGEEKCWQGGACAFVDYVLPATIAGSTCVSEAIWNNGYNCGGCVEITYKGKKKIAMITNKTGGDAVHLDMSPNMFAQLADKKLGEINMQWTHVPCPITTPLQIKMHGGSSQWWFAASVMNAVHRTASLEVSADGGATWKPTVRNINNFFEFAKSGGTNTKTAWVRVTSETGSQVIVKDVKLVSSTVTSGTTNYGT